MTFEILIWAAITLFVIHYTVEAIVEPTVRLVLRHRLFALRDDLRSLLADEDHHDRELVEFLNSVINFRISENQTLDIVTLFWSIRKLRKQADFDETLKGVADLARRIEQDSELSAIREKLDKVFVATVLLNSLMLIIYTLPLAVVLTYCLHIIKKLKRLAASPLDLQAAYS